MAVHSRPTFIKPSSIAHGDFGTAKLVYLSPAIANSSPAVAPSKTSFTFSARRARTAPAKAKTIAPKPLQPRANDAPENALKAGSPFGSAFDGPTSGEEVSPAIPLVFPDPFVSRSEIPSGVQGDVIVEITIDAQGNVIDTKLLQNFGYGIEEKVLAALHNWRFRPATRDGRAIASKQDVHFHFPA
ncbi:MAG TPA: TonB family protein [Terriglobales bacterium]